MKQTDADEVDLDNVALGSVKVSGTCENETYSAEDTERVLMEIQCLHERCRLEGNSPEVLGLCQKALSGDVAAANNAWNYIRHLRDRGLWPDGWPK